MHETDISEDLNKQGAAIRAGLPRPSDIREARDFGAGFFYSSYTDTTVYCDDVRVARRIAKGEI